MVAVLAILLLLYCQEASTSCSNQQTCGSCIGYAEEKCVWCLEANITTSRCQPEDVAVNNKFWCKNTFIYNPKMEELKEIVNNTQGSNPSEIPPQIAPQVIKVKLRPGALFNFQMTYKRAEDFPLDIYFLMDYSYTMHRHVDELRIQALSLYEELVGFTNNVQFGVGSFVEKPAFPYVNILDQQAYSFKNHLPLTKNMTLFEKMIQDKPSGSNLDDPEGGLDALMQVMVCEKKLGWRPEARRIIIVCTDATYHSAGDGKMVGADRPNDMKCGLDNQNMYQNGLTQDYPSLSQLNKMASDGNFLIIFAATKNVKQEYEYLSQEILGANYAELKQDSNLVDIIKTAYLKSVAYVSMKYNWPSHVQLKLEPDCTKADLCRIIHKQVVKMNASIKVTSCPKDQNGFMEDLEVGLLSGGLKDKLKISLEINCQCDCEKGGSDIVNSPLCSNFGTLQCGICKCNNDRYGAICQCDNPKNSKTEIDKCKQHSNQTGYCNKRGICECGRCNCESGYSGTFCEFDDSSCKTVDNKLCSGQGSCSLGKCNCNSKWTGDDCSCSLDKNSCYAPYSKQICSGNGECPCGECICNKKKDSDSVSLGVFCEEEQCKDLAGYAKCNQQHNKTYCDQLDEYNQTLSTEVMLLNKTEINNATWPLAKWCHETLANGTLVFIYVYDNTNKKLQLIIQKDLDELENVNPLVAVGSAIGSVLLIGLLTVIIWKFIVDAMDKKEYEKFLKEAQDAGYVPIQNPIFQPAAVNFRNPAYDNAGRR